MAKEKLPNDQVEFVLQDGTINFLKLFAGQARASKDAIHKSYGLEWSGNIAPDSPIVRAVTNVAKHYDKANWDRHIWAPFGALLRLEEKCAATGRDISKYPYAHGMYVIGINKVVSRKMAGLDENANLSDPLLREKYDRYVDSVPPKVSRFADPNNPFDVQAIEGENRKRVLANLTPYREADYYKVMLPVKPEEIWGGCIAKVCARAYWLETKKQVCFGLEQVLLVRQGPRLQGMDKSPDEVFGAFAPAASLAPPPPAPPAWNL